MKHTKTMVAMAAVKLAAYCAENAGEIGDIQAVLDGVPGDGCVEYNVYKPDGSLVEGLAISAYAHAFNKFFREHAIPVRALEPCSAADVLLQVRPA